MKEIYSSSQRYFKERAYGQLPQSWFPQPLWYGYWQPPSTNLKLRIACRHIWWGDLSCHSTADLAAGECAVRCRRHESQCGSHLVPDTVYTANTCSDIVSQLHFPRDLFLRWLYERVTAVRKRRDTSLGFILYDVVPENLLFKLDDNIARSK